MVRYKASLLAMLAAAEATSTCAHFLHICYISSTSFIPISSDPFRCPFSNSPHSHQPSNRSLLHLSENQATAPQPTRERWNPLSTLVEICHPGADVTSDLVRREDRRRGAMEERGEVCCSTKVRQGGDRHARHVRKRPSLALTRTHAHKHTHTLSLRGDSGQVIRSEHCLVGVISPFRTL